METGVRAALVTGGNKGLGFETARQLARLGHVVWLGCRDRGRGEAAAEALAGVGDVRFLGLDVTDGAGVKNAAARLAEQVDGLDVLVNNAGVLFTSEEALPSVVDPDVVRRTLEVNFLGTLQVTQAFLPLLRNSPAGRIVNVSSRIGSLNTLMAPGNPLGVFPSFAYPVSKTGLSALTGWLAVELRDTAIKVNAVCPGYNATDMNDNMGTLPASEGARIIAHAATLPADGPSGTFFDANGPVEW